jgi:multiple sugar transport system permease protein
MDDFDSAAPAAVATASTWAYLVLALLVSVALVTFAFLVVPKLAANKKSAPYVFVSPFFIVFFVFGLFPILFSLYLSFQVWDPATGLAGIKLAGMHGFENYSLVFTDEWFWLSLKNTFWIAVASGLPQHAVCMPLAYFFHIAYKRFRNTITGAYFLPFITSSVAISLIFSTMFSKDFGVINAMLDSAARLPVIGHIFPAHHIDWLGKTPTTKPAVSFVVWWRYLGWNTVLYLSALQAISADLFEAADMDGASRWQTFRHVVLPLLRPMMLFAITLTIIGNLQLFEEPFIILGANGGVEKSGLTAAMYVYQNGFAFGDFGIACAISWVLFVLIAILTYVNNRIFARHGGTEGAA